MVRQKETLASVHNALKPECGLACTLGLPESPESMEGLVFVGSLHRVIMKETGAGQVPRESPLGGRWAGGGALTHTKFIYFPGHSLQTRQHLRARGQGQGHAPLLLPGWEEKQNPADHGKEAGNPPACRTQGKTNCWWGRAGWEQDSFAPRKEGTLRAEGLHLPNTRADPRSEHGCHGEKA